MWAGRPLKATAPAILPLVMLLVPKHPLCLQPLFVAAGPTLPPRGLLDGLLAAEVTAWLALLAGATLLTEALLLCGRWLDLLAAGRAAAVNDG